MKKALLTLAVAAVAAAVGWKVVAGRSSAVLNRLTDDTDPDDSSYGSYPYDARGDA